MQPPRIVYSRRYNIGFWGLERLHPFDSRKYGRAWNLLKHHFGSKQLRQFHIKPMREASLEELNLVHTQDYLKKLRDANYLSRAIAVPQLGHAPARLIDWRVLRPMRWAVRGTIIAAKEALSCGTAINLSGGYHHAKPDRGEGFSIYNDIGIAIASLRNSGQIDRDDRVVYIDTDAHQGNGVCHTFKSDGRFFIFDIFNSRIYPMFDVEARERIDCEVPLVGPSSDDEYMDLLQQRLPGFMDSVTRSKVGMAFYNAGTDPYAEDALGGLAISAATILKRDLYVLDQLRSRKIPTVMVLSGGYSRESYKLVADSVIAIIEGELKRQKSR
ncbi:MAG: histone deacetylase [Planctomycetota bacterium]